MGWDDASAAPTKSSVLLLYIKIRNVNIFPAVDADSLGATARIPYSPGPSAVGSTSRNCRSPTVSTPNHSRPIRPPPPANLNRCEPRVEIKLYF